MKLEGDVQIVINAMQHDEHDWLWYRGLVEDIKSVLRYCQHWSIALHTGNETLPHTH